MIQLKLQIEDVLQGHFRLGELNLLLFFQASCPGCFSYAIPETNALVQEHGEWLQFFGVSTMFENPDLNTMEQVKSFLWSGSLVGEAADYFKDLGLDRYPHEISFPVLQDKLVKPSDYIENEMERLCLMHPAYTTWSAYDQQQLQGKIKEYVAAYPKAGFSFVFNMLRGTPTWVLITEEMQLLGTWFGYEAVPDMKKTLLEIKEDLNKNSGASQQDAGNSE
ncbi:MAG: hypothetical protein MUF42_06210 [Cytophagaceae bacterium]|jgi:hypothetical protein|nr:hypothetical protein [Cytophagaceae bacterium]